MQAPASLDLLWTFTAVADAESFTAAARKRGVPPSTVSRAVAALEASLGVQLFHRTTRHVALTTAGSALYERVAPLLASLEEAVGHLPEQEEQPSGELRVTAPVDIGVVFLCELVHRFTVRFPAVKVDVHLANRRVDLVAEGFDLALRAAPKLKDSSLIARKASRLIGGLFAAPSYLARRGTPRAPADLDDHDWVAFRGLDKMTLTGPSGAVTVRSDARIRGDDMFFMRETLRTGSGIGYLPAFLAAGDIASGQLVRVLPRYATHGSYLWLVSPATRHVPRKVSAFRDMVLEALRANPLG